MTDADLLDGLSPVERALALLALRREEISEQWLLTRAVPRKPTDEELIAAGWKSPPEPPPTEAELLQCLRNAHRELRPRSWALFNHAEDEVLLTLHAREPGRLRHKVTKRWGHMWRLTPSELAKESTP